MAGEPLHAHLRRWLRARAAGPDGALTDGELLGRFAAARDEAAFEVLVWRHGPMVLGVGRRLLRDAADAEDVFQATFLILSRRAGALRRRAALAAWLYRVAHRAALRLQAARARRAARERLPASDVPAPAAAAAEPDLAGALYDEVNRLPERYREAVVLCYLQGRTTAEAARALGCARGTVLSRLAWARQRLRRRLARRGLAPAALATLAAAGRASAPPAPEAVARVVKVATAGAAGAAACGAVAPQVMDLVRGGLRAMLWAKLKVVGLVVVAAGLAGAGLGTRYPAPAEAGPEPPAARASDPPPAAAPAREPHRLDEAREELARREEELARAEDRQLAELLEARKRVLLAEEKLRRTELELRGQRTQDDDRLTQLRHRKTAAAQMLAKLKEVTPEQRREMDQLVDEIRRQEAMIRAREAEGPDLLLRIRLELMEAQERLRVLERRQAEQRDRLASERDTAAGRLRHLLEDQPRRQAGEAPGPAAARLADLERKVDRLLRETAALREELRRARAGSSDKE
jgi:RNA polymerase sigma factor (sigma-70 family)